MQLTDLRPAQGATKAPKRVGRGHGSGWGKTATRGYNGQGQRSGESQKIGFEGGQMPLYRRMPKKKHFQVPARYQNVIVTVNVKELAKFEAGTEVTPNLLVEHGLIRDKFDIVKVLGNGELNVKLTVKAMAFSASAKEKIEAAGGTAEVLG